MMNSSLTVIVITFLLFFDVTPTSATTLLDIRHFRIQSTLGRFLVDRSTLENEVRQQKLYGDTCEKGKYDPIL